MTSPSEALALRIINWQSHSGSEPLSELLAQYRAAVVEECVAVIEREMIWGCEPYAEKLRALRSKS